jgi:hypothetical protein
LITDPAFYRLSNFPGNRWLNRLNVLLHRLHLSGGWEHPWCAWRLSNVLSSNGENVEPTWRRRARQLTHTKHFRGWSRAARDKQ